MKSTPLKILLSFCLIIASFTTFAKKAELKIWLTKGQSFTYLIAQEITAEEKLNGNSMTHKNALKINFTVAERLPNNNYKINATIKSFGTEYMKSGKLNRYYSDTVDVTNKLYKTMLFLKDLQFNYELSPEGVVTNLNGYDVITNKAEQNPRLQNILRNFGNEQYLMEFFHYIPQKKVKAGSKWTNSATIPKLLNLKYDIRYAYKEKSEKDITLSQDADFKFYTEIPVSDSITNYLSETGTQVGIIKIDPKTSMPITSDITQKIVISTYNNKTAAIKAEPGILTTKTNITRVKK